MTSSLDRKLEASRKRAEEERRKHPGLFGGKVEGLSKPASEEAARQAEPSPKSLPPPKGQR